MKRIRWRQLLLRGGAVLLLAALLGLGWLLLDRHHARRAWEHYRANALARGVRLHLADFLTPEIPAAESYITGTIFERLFEPEAWQKYHLPVPAKLDPKATLLESLEAERLAFVKEKWLPKENAPAEAAPAVLLALERFRPELDELRAARPRPGSRLPPSTKPPPYTEFRGGLLAMNIDNILAYRLKAHLALAQPGEALEDFRDLLRLHRALRDEPAMIQPPVV